MNTEFLTLTPEQLDELDALNACAPDNNRIEAVGNVIAADLLTDCGPGQTFAHYEEFLRSLTEPTPEPKRKKRSNSTNDKN